MPKSFGFIYFDGDHRDEIVFEELKKFIPLICPEGLFSVDDQDDLDHYSGVIDIIPTKASNRLFFDLSKKEIS